MGHEHVYVTFAGQLLGVIRRSPIGDGRVNRRAFNARLK